MHATTKMSLKILEMSTIKDIENNLFPPLLLPLMNIMFSDEAKSMHLDSSKTILSNGIG